MAETPPTQPITPDHIGETVRSISQLRATHHEAATPQQRAIDRVTFLLGRPRFIFVLSTAIGAWIGLNLIVQTLGFYAIDPPPFPWLTGVATLASLYMVVLILTTQRREDRLAQHRELPMLELALLGEQKTAKVIQLLEESRRDNPMIHDRHDAEAETMAQPSDPRSVLDAIKEAHVSTPE